MAILLQLDSANGEIWNPICDFNRKEAEEQNFHRLFTERGLYMFATIWKGPQAIHTTLANHRHFCASKRVDKNWNHQMANAKDEQKSEMF